MEPERVWREITDRAELDARRVFPFRVTVACLYDHPSMAMRGQYAVVLDAEYNGSDFGRLGGGPLGGTDGLVLTHWTFLREPPPEAEMLRVALAALPKVAGGSAQ